MTYGSLLTRARLHIDDAAEQMTTAKPRGAQDVLALAALRTRLYRQLHRHADLLADDVDLKRLRTGRPAAVTPEQVALFQRELAVAAMPAGVPDTVRSDAAVCRSVSAAVDELGAAADILASHLTPRPRTPEGVAIRGGAGVLPALVGLAHIAGDAVALDLAALAWSAGGDEITRTLADWAATPARHATTGALPGGITAITASGPNGPALLDQLTAAPSLAPTPGERVGPGRAGPRLHAAAAWLWQHPDQLHAVHVRLAAQIGLATALLAADRRQHSQTTRAWHNAIEVATTLRGSPPVGGTLTDPWMDRLVRSAPRDPLLTDPRWVAAKRRHSGASVVDADVQ